jgi:hypothetical protein
VAVGVAVSGGFGVLVGVGGTLGLLLSPQASCSNIRTEATRM